MAETVLQVTNALGSRRFSGWTSIDVTRSLEQFAATFSVEFIGESPTDDRSFAINGGDACEVYLDDDLVVSGYVDDRSIYEAVGDFRMAVSGRSKAGDLVDCSSIHGKTGSWSNSGLLTIALDLVKPFGLPVVVDGSANLGDTFSSFAVQDGESVYDTLERGCRAKGVLLASDADGTIRFTSVSKKSTSTKILRGPGGNVVAGGSTESWRERYSQIVVKSQSPGNPNLFGQTVAQQKYTIEDSTITRYRPLVIKAEKGFGTASKLKTRAVWERNVRAGRSQRLTYTLDGWKNNEGLWAPNVLVRVYDPKLQVDTTLLVVSVRQYKNLDQGTNTDLELCDPRAMTVEPLTTQKAKKHGSNFFLTGSAPNGVEDDAGSAAE